MRKGLIYCRVSTKEQADEGMSLMSQERLCKEYAQKNGIEIERDRIFIERGKSAKTVDRLELQRMLRYCKLNEKNIDCLIIYKIDRLSRKTHDYLTLKAVLASCGVNIISITEPIEDSPMGKFIEGTLANVAQLDNDMRAERTKDGMIEALMEGRYIFKAPEGYRNYGTKGNSNIKPIPSKAQKIKKVFEELSKGFKSQEEIRQFAAKIGLVQSNGKPLNKSHFYKMLRKPVYKGWIHIENLGIDQKGSFDPIVKPEMFDLVQQILDGKSKKLPIYKKIHPDFPLRGTVKCSCGNVMTSNWSRGEGGKYGYYRCTTCKGVNLRKETIEEAFRGFLDGARLNENIADIVKVAIKLNWEERGQNIEKEARDLEKRKLQLLKQEDEVINKNLTGVYKDSVAKRQLGKIEEEISGVNIELMKKQKPSEEESELVTYAIDLLSNMTQTWDKMDATQQNKFQKFIFPNGLTFEEGKFKTDEKILTVAMNETLNSKNSTKVP